MEADTSFSAPWLPALLQTADPLFPTGAYAHSFGLEELVRLEVVQNEAGLVGFLKNQMLPQLEQLELPYLRFGMEGAGRLETLLEVDWEINAWKLAAEARSSSVQIGTRRLAALSRMHAHPLTSAYQAAVQRGDAPGHHVCVCAVQAIVLEIPSDAALLSYGYQSLAGVCTAALKLIRIGQDGVQRALSAGVSELDGAVRRSLMVQREAAGCFLPMLEIAAMRHAQAHERLFIS